MITNYFRVERISNGWLVTAGDVQEEKGAYCKDLEDVKETINLLWGGDE